MSKNKNKPGEFNWIGQVREMFSSLLPAGMEGIGDDCAVIPIGNGESLVVTTDMLVEGVHFLPDKISPEELGYKSLAVNLSDVAAMGATPTGSFLSVGFPGHVGEDWQNGFLRGYKKLSEEFDVPLLGGDTTASEKWIISVTAIGKIANTDIKRRSGAKSGDLVCVTGNLGNSAAGLRLLLNKNKFSDEETALTKDHLHPKPYVLEGEWLGAREDVHAMMDVSDGIASDLVHILEASGVSAEVELTHLPFSDAFKKTCRKYDWNAEELAVSGGEDYVLLLTVDPDHFQGLNEEYKNRFGRNLTAIGRVEEGLPRISWLKNGKIREANWKGFEHF